MMRTLLFALGLLALLGVAPVAVAPVLAANIPACTGSGGTNPCPDPLIQSTYNGLVNAVNTNVTSATMGAVGNFRNLLDNPKFDIYPVSSGAAYTGSTITTTLTGINTTCTFMPSRWCVYAGAGGASAQIGWASAQTGFQSGLQVGRTSGNANTTQICAVQVIPMEKTIEMQGQQLYLSFSALAGAGFSAASNNLQLFVLTGTGADQGTAALIGVAPGTINGWTGPNNQLNGTTQAITTTFTRYTGINAGVVPANALEMALEICYTPVGTAGAADNFQIFGVQLEAGPGSSAFEMRPLAVETQLVGRNGSQSISDGATTRRYTVGLATAATTAQFAVPLSPQMRAAPTTVVEGTSLFQASNGAGTGIQCTTMAAISTSNTVNSVGIQCTCGASLTQGQASELLGFNTGAVVLFNGEL